VDRSRLAVVIPAYNEEAAIAKVVASVRERATVVVVDDGSSDNTASAAEAAGARVVRHDENLGYDAALNSGFAEASRLACDLVVTMYGDGQHDPALLDAFAAALRERCDVVLGIRPRCGRFTEMLFGWAARLRFGIRDPLCGMRGFRMGVYRALGHYDSYKSIGTELMLFAAKRGDRIEQMPVPVKPRAAGASRFGHTLRANLRILRALFLGLFT